MKLFLYSLLFTVSAQHNLKSHDYLVPLGALSDGLILVSHFHTNPITSPSKKNKNNVREVHLYAWDPESKEMTPLLSSLYQPLFAQTIPQSQEFSFIDEGRLRIKNLNKRSPATIAISDKKIIESAMYCWIDAQTCMLCAWRYYPTIENNHIVSKSGTYGIYRLHRDGQVTSIVTSPEYDTLWPIVAGNSLFCIRRLMDKETEIVSSFIIQVDLTDPEHHQEIILEDHSGREFDGIIAAAEDELYSFLFDNGLYHCIHCIKESDGSSWHFEDLFTFQARGVGYQDPFGFFSPILVENSLLIYLDVAEIKSYNLITGESVTILEGNEYSAYCAPCFCNGTLYCGCNVEMNDIRFWSDDHMTLSCDLPAFTLSELQSENFLHQQESAAVNDCGALAEQAEGADS